MLEVVGFPLAFIFFALLMLWVIIYGKGKWYVKAGFMVAALFIFSWLWGAATDFLGWASPEELPEVFQVHWIVVEEPSSRSEGSIFVLASDMTEDNYNSFSIFYNSDSPHEPRLHELPYTKQGHKEADDFLEQLKKGQRLIMRNVKKMKNKKGDEAGEEMGNQKSLQDRMFESAGRRLPPKPE
jgi:hypothetical protein